MSSSILGKSVIVVPPQTITQAETHELVDKLVSDEKERQKLHQIVQNTNIAKRHSCIPIQKVLEQDTSPGGRHKLYLPIAREFTQRVAERALYEVNATPADIDAIIVTSCTGFAMPSLGNYLISDMGFRHTTRVLPVAQWGCAGSVAALNWAHTHCLAHPDKAVLFVAVELCSLMYQPSDKDVSMMICNSLFGDAAGGVVIMGEKNPIVERQWPHTSAALRVLKHQTFCPPDKMHYLFYDEDHEGWHFRLAPNVVSTVGTIAPYMKAFLENECNQDISEPCMRYLVHTGGPKILQELLDELFPEYKTNDPDLEVIMQGCNPKNRSAVKYLSNSRVRQIDNSLTTMRGFGNTSSVTVLTEIRLEMQAYERRISTGENCDSFPCLMVACGPGFTAEWAYAKFFQRPGALMPNKQAIERPVCFTMELPKLDVVVIGDDVPALFLATRLCARGLTVGSLANLDEESSASSKVTLTDDELVKQMKLVGLCNMNVTESQNDVAKALRHILNQTYRKEDKLVPLWSYSLKQVGDTLDVDRASRFVEMDNNVLTLILEHEPTGITQQVQTKTLVASTGYRSEDLKVVRSVKSEKVHILESEESIETTLKQCAMMSETLASSVSGLAQ